MWKEGKTQGAFPSDFSKNNYLEHIKAGTGFPSFWLIDDFESLKKIALGILLCRKSFDKVELVGFEDYCFSVSEIEIKQVTSLDFPMQSVRHLHYELVLEENSDEDLSNSIETFFKCYGCFKQFKKFPQKESNDEDESMLEILTKYQDDIIGDSNIEMARKWIESNSKRSS